MEVLEIILFLKYLEEIPAWFNMVSIKESLQSAITQMEAKTTCRKVFFFIPK